MEWTMFHVPWNAPCSKESSMKCSVPWNVQWNVPRNAPWNVPCYVPWNVLSSMFYVPRSKFQVPCSMFQVPRSMFLVLCSMEVQWNVHGTAMLQCFIIHVPYSIFHSMFQVPCPSSMFYVQCSRECSLFFVPWNV